MSTCRINRVLAREVFDSRGRPTIEVEIGCTEGAWASAIAPSGASTGRHEALEFRDRNAARLAGRGVRQAVQQVHELVAPLLAGRDVADQAEIDRLLIELDGTSNKSRLGGNATTAVSLAAAHAAAAAQGIPLVEHLHDVWRRTATSGPEAARPAATARLGNSLLLPLPMVNMISGGLHAGGNLDLQDFLILPVGAGSYREALDWVVGVYHALGELLSECGYEGVLVGDEGGFGPRLANNAQAPQLLVEAIERARLEPGTQVAIGLDVAATHLLTADGYRLRCEPDQSSTGFQAVPAMRTSDDLIDLFADWVRKYPIVSIEDPLAEDDEAGWRQITARLGGQVQLIGDDLFVTNSDRLLTGIERGLANSVLIKVNQVGTLSETLAAMRIALSAGFRPVISARSGETEDATIADLAVATGAGQIKIGSVARSERLAKYNQLLRLEERLGSQAEYAGGAILQAVRSGRAVS